MGAKIKSSCPVVQYTEMDMKMCECPRYRDLLDDKNFFKCKDSICQHCLRRISNPGMNSNPRVTNIPILHHIKTSNFENKLSEFQKLLKAQRKSSFLELLPSKSNNNHYTDEVLRSQFPIISQIVPPSNLTHSSVGTIPAACEPKQTMSKQQWNHFRSRVTISSNNNNAIDCLPEAAFVKRKIPLDEITKSRVRDCDGFIRRAACVCVNEDQSMVVLVSSKNNGGGWLIPGGGLEDGEEEVVAATREAWEEAGVRGKVDRWLGMFQCEDEITKKKKRTSVFVLQVAEELNEFPEAHLGRVRRWYDFHEAKKVLSVFKPDQMTYLNSLVNSQ